MNRLLLLCCMLAANLSSGGTLAANEVFRFEGSQSFERLGRSAGRAGDFNGDGYGDVIVGAGFSVQDGAVSIYSGRDGTRLWYQEGPDGFGVRVAGGSDFDNDGYDDFLVGDQNGAFFVFAGGTGNLLFSDQPGSVEADRVELAVVGDLNGDHRDDFVVGIPWDGNWLLSPRSGRIMVYSGRDFTLLYGEIGVPEQALGWDVCAAGDVDGDLRADYAVTAYGSADPLVPAFVRVYSGFDHSIIYELLMYHGAGFGHALRGDIDLNDDQVPDILVSSPWTTVNGNTSAGSVFALSGVNGGLLWALHGSQASEVFGLSLSCPGDLNGDGVGEFLVCAPGHSGSDGLGSWQGAAYVFSGVDTSVIRLERGRSPGSSSFASRVSEVGDINRDGVGDYAVSDHQHDGLFTNTGASYVYSGVDYPASSTNYGTGYAGSNGIPELYTVGLPDICEQLILEIGNSYGAPTVAMVFISAQQTDIPTGWGGHLLVQPGLSFPLRLPAAGQSVALRVICDTAFAGESFNLQVLEIDPGATDGVSFSRGLELVHGF